MNLVIELENMLQTTFNALPPLLLAGLGGMITSKVGVLNLGLEGMMLMGAFVAILTNFYTGSSMLGLLAALLLGSLIGFLFAVFNIRFRVNNIIMSVGINMLAVAVTKYLLGVIFDTSGAFTSSKVVKMPTVSIPFLKGVPILNTLSGLSVVFWLALASTLVLGVMVNYTSWGLRVRATGLNDLAVHTAGVDPSRVRYACITLSGTLCGAAGAYLSTSYLAMFTNGMTNGRGFLGNIASVMGNRTALGTFLGSLLFSVTDGATMKIQTFGFPSQLIQLIPYTVAFAVVILNALIKRAGKARAR
ncbi:conserved membrane hypothetical protein [uncultured Eubacteriales bacterium]|uniref:ABC transporter permease n=1 Tax=uncultured Eubacteriales bacterium TaxID=172733 RepID=A0A212JPE3_9FIRM|nr:conserved membrane hypothetical protein [uncultured Eubacteriales bacterium]